VSRELLSGEDLGLLGYWKFSRGTWSPVGNQRSYPDYSATGNSATADPRATESRGFVLGLLNGESISGVFAVAGAHPLTQALVGTPSDLYLYSVAGRSWSHLLGMKAPSPHRWASCAYEQVTVLCNGLAENMTYSAVGVRPLSLQDPDPGAVVSAVAAGAGGALGVGVYRYRFTFYDSARDVESWTGALLPSQVTVAAGQEVTLGSVTPLPLSMQAGVDEVRVYRTAVGGNDYYLLTAVANGSATYVDAAADSSLSTPLDEYRGYAPPSRFCFSHHGRVWLGNFGAGGESKLMYSEAGSYSSFYAENEVFVGDGDNDGLMGAWVGSDLVVLFKRRSIWALVGNNPNEYRAIVLHSGVGLLEQATLAAGGGWLYWLSAGGVYRVPAAAVMERPVRVGGHAIRPLIAALPESAWPACSACFDTVKQRYYLSAGGRTLVWNVEREHWSAWNLDVGAWLEAWPESGLQEMWVGFRGSLCRLDGDSDGVQVVDAAARAVSGAVTGGGAS